jgi:hypothetical protein
MGRVTDPLEPDPSITIAYLIASCEEEQRAALRDPNLVTLLREHPGGLTDWWREDPAGDAELDNAQFHETVRRTAEVALQVLPRARLLDVPAHLAATIPPLSDLGEVCRVGCSVGLPVDPLCLRFDPAGIEVPDQGIAPRPMFSAVLCWKEQGPLSLIPFTTQPDSDPRPYGQVLFDETRELGVPFHRHPGLTVYGREDVGLFTPPIVPTSQSASGAVWRTSQMMIQRTLALLEGLEKQAPVVNWRS